MLIFSSNKNRTFAFKGPHWFIVFAAGPTASNLCEQHCSVSDLQFWARYFIIQCFIISLKVRLLFCQEAFD